MGETCATCTRFGFLGPGTCAYGGSPPADTPACDMFFPRYTEPMSDQPKKLDGAEFVAEFGPGAKTARLPNGAMLVLDPNRLPFLVDQDGAREVKPMTARLTTEELAELERLAEKALQNKLRLFKVPRERMWDIRDESPDGFTVDLRIEHDGVWPRKCLAEIECMVASRNALPSLLEEVKALRVVAEAAKNLNESATRRTVVVGGRGTQSTAFAALRDALAKLDRGTG